MSRIKIKEQAWRIKQPDNAGLAGIRMKRTLLKPSKRLRRPVQRQEENGTAADREYAEDKLTAATEDISRTARYITVLGIKVAKRRKKAVGLPPSIPIMDEETLPNEFDVAESTQIPVKDEPNHIMEQGRQLAIRRLQQQRQINRHIDRERQATASEYLSRGEPLPTRQNSQDRKASPKIKRRSSLALPKSREVPIKMAVSSTVQGRRIKAEEIIMSPAGRRKVLRGDVVKDWRLAIKAAEQALTSTRVLSLALAGACAGILVLLLVVFCLIGSLGSSGFGIFFSGEDSGTGQTVRTAIQEIQQDYADRLTAIQENNPHDILQIFGYPPAWPEVLAVYAVKTTTAKTGGQDVATMNDEKKALLQTVFWDMTSITYRRIAISDTVTALYIWVTPKTAAEMADEYVFDSSQRTQLAELLAEDKAELWHTVLYGDNEGGESIVAVALSQLGNVGGERYWRWYGFETQVEWCACFVSWCANECGYLEAGVLPKFAGCVQGAAWFKNCGLWQDNRYEPRPGDIIFFDWDDDEGQDSICDHVGIVEKVAEGKVYTIEGNAANACREKSYPLGHYEIYGYGTPIY